MDERDEIQEEREEQSQRKWWGRAKTATKKLERKPSALTIDQVRARDSAIKQQAAADPYYHAQFVNSMESKGVAVNPDYAKFKAQQQMYEQQQRQIQLQQQSQYYRAVEATQVLHDQPPAAVTYPPQQLQYPPPASPNQEKRSLFGKKKSTTHNPTQPHTLSDVEAADKFLATNPQPTQYPTYMPQPQSTSSAPVARGLRGYSVEGTELYPPTKPTTASEAQSRHYHRRHHKEKRSSKRKSHKHSTKKEKKHYRKRSHQSKDSSSSSDSDLSSSSSLSSRSSSSSSLSGSDNDDELIPPPWLRQSKSAQPKFKPNSQYAKWGTEELDRPSFAPTWESEKDKPYLYQQYGHAAYSDQGENWDAYNEMHYEPHQHYPQAKTPQWSFSEPGVSFVDEVVPAPYTATSPQWGREGRSVH